jgi:inner membrane protein
VLSFGTFTHLVLDQMWLSPRTLFWPLYGYTFERLEFTGFIKQILGILLADPAIYVPEIIGGVVLVVFGWVLVANRKLRAFITTGRL